MMLEETSSADQRLIPLTPAEYDELATALQWPEERDAWIQLNTPTNLADLCGGLHTPL